MINDSVWKRKSVRELDHKNHADCMKVIELYDKWDVAAKNKDFHNAEHFEYMIQKIHRRNGVKES